MVARGGDEHWEALIDGALERWQEALGPDCPMPFYRVGEDDAADARPVTLVPAAQWERDGMVGLWYWDGGIDILATSTYQDLTLLHEFGHALVGPWHSDDPLDIMSTGYKLSPETIAHVRDARGCP